MTTEAGDMFLLYSDAFIESVNGENQMLGIRGLVELLNETNHPDPNEVIPFLRNRIGAFSTGNLLDDDATLILGHFTSTKVRLLDNLMAPIRLMGDVCNNTQIGE